MFRTYVFEERVGSDRETALKALMTGETQASQSGRLYSFEEIDSELMEEENKTKNPFSSVEEPEEPPEIIQELEDFASYRDQTQYSDISDDEKERRDEILEEMMEDVEEVFEGYIEDRNQPYEEFEEDIPEVPEEITDRELRNEIREIKEKIKDRKEQMMTLDIDPLSLVELYKVPSANSAAADGNHRINLDGELHTYRGVDPERIQPLENSLVSTIDIPVNRSSELSLYSRLPGDEYMEEARKIVANYEDELREA